MRRRTVSWSRRLERLIRSDPNRRGLAADRDLGISARVQGHLYRAARRLARPNGIALVLTGFPVPTAGKMAPETDGPPGAVLLAATLQCLGWKVYVATDQPNSPVVSRCLQELKSAGVQLPFLDGGCPGESEAVALQRLQRLLPDRPSVTVAVERPGPSHDPQSAKHGTEPDPVFTEVVPPEHWGQYHSCRGNIITAHCAPLHVWFEQGEYRVAVGDGGNEIGMGVLPWRLLHMTVAGGVGGLIACRTAAHHLILAGISNWGAMALALAAAKVALKPSAARWVTPEWHRRLLAACLEAGAVDGITGRPVPLVDGQPAWLHERLIVAARHAVRLPQQ